MSKALTTAIQILLASALLAFNAPAQTGTTQQPPAAKAAPGANGQQPSTPAIPELPTQKEKISYAIGMTVGKGLHRDAIEVDPSIVLRGLKDALAGGTTLMTDDQAQAAIVELQAQVRAREEAKRQQDAETNKKEGDAFMAANKTKPGVVALPSGLQYKVIKDGTGPKPTINDAVTVQYRGTLINGKEFDSTYKRGEPATFPIKGIIKGWTEALQLMPVGSKWELYLPPDLAYGERGAGSDIGPNESLIFEVELLSIADTGKPAGGKPDAGNSDKPQQQ